MTLLLTIPSLQSPLVASRMCADGSGAAQYRDSPDPHRDCVVTCETNADQCTQIMNDFPRGCPAYEEEDAEREWIIGLFVVEN